MPEGRIAAAREAMNGLTDAACDLEDRSRAADKLGMAGLASGLWELALHIRRYGNALYECWSDEFNERCDASEQATRQVLEAAFTGIIGPKGG